MRKKKIITKNVGINGLRNDLTTSMSSFVNTLKLWDYSKSSKVLNSGDFNENNLSSIG
jgi:hypothetical protein